MIKKDHFEKNTANEMSLYQSLVFTLSHHLMNSLPVTILFSGLAPPPRLPPTPSPSVYRTSNTTLGPGEGLQGLFFPNRPLTFAASSAVACAVRAPVMQIWCHNIKRRCDQRSALLCVGVWYQNFYFISSCRGLLTLKSERSRAGEAKQERQLRQKGWGEKVTHWAWGRAGCRFNAQLHTFMSTGQIQVLLFV